MALDFLPFQTGQLITADDLNALVAAIQDGSIFLNVSYITTQLSTTGVRLTDLEARVAYLESLQASLAIRDPFILAAGQSVVNLAKTPILDTETLFLNGAGLAKTGIPIGFVGDYTISGSVITFNSELATQILDGDQLAVCYRYEV